MYFRAITSATGRTIIWDDPGCPGMVTSAQSPQNFRESAFHCQDVPQTPGLLAARAHKTTESRTKIARVPEPEVDNPSGRIGAVPGPRFFHPFHQPCGGAA